MTTAIEFEVQGMKELTQRMNRASDTVIRVTLNDGLRRLGRLFVPAKGSGPLARETPKRTGKLARSTYFRIAGGPRDQRLEVLQPAMTEEGAFYGFWVREGTDPHIIRPRRAKALRFEIDGEIIFAMKVNHPGTDPNPYHKRVLAQLRGGVQQIVNDMGAKITAYLSGR